MDKSVHLLEFIIDFAIKVLNWEWNAKNNNKTMQSSGAFKTL